MKKELLARAVPAFAAIGALVALPAAAQVNNPSHEARSMSGYNEVPALSSPATGSFVLDITNQGNQVQYELTYSGFETPVTAAHLHLGLPGTSGGIIVFLCSSTGGAPAGTPACPQFGGTVTGTLTSASVIGPADQGISAGEFPAFLAAIRAEATYANVHTQAHPMGEIRAQVVRRNSSDQRSAPATTPTPRPTPSAGTTGGTPAPRPTPTLSPTVGVTTVPTPSGTPMPRPTAGM